MHRYDIATCGETELVEFFWVRYHQVDIERESLHSANCIDSVGAETYVGGEISLCNVYRNHFCALFFRSTTLSFLVCFYSHKNRRGDVEAVHSSTIDFTS